MNLCDLGRVIILILCINGKNNDEGIEFRRFNISKDCEYSFKCNTNSIYNDSAIRSENEEDVCVIHSRRDYDLRNYSM